MIPDPLQEAKKSFEESIDILTGWGFGRDDEQEALSCARDYIKLLEFKVEYLQESLDIWRSNDNHFHIDL